MITSYCKELIKVKNIRELRKELVILKEMETKPNFADLGRQYDCDYRTAKKYYEKAKIEIKPRI